MDLFRIGSARHPLLSGEGARLFGSRWNSPGRSVIYAGLSLSVCLLERLVHTGRLLLPAGDVWLQMVAPEDVPFELADPAEITGWDARDQLSSRRFGDQWLEGGKTALLIVPSVVAFRAARAASPGDRNAVVNPLHPDFARLEVSKTRQLIWDERLFQP